MSNSFCVTGSTFSEPFANIQQPNGNINMNYTFSCSGTTTMGMNFGDFETREQKAERIRKERKKKLERVFNEKHFDNINLPKVTLAYIDFIYESDEQKREKKRIARKKKLERVLNERRTEE